MEKNGLEPLYSTRSFPDKGKRKNYPLIFILSSSAHKGPFSLNLVIKYKLLSPIDFLDYVYTATPLRGLICSENI